MTKLTETHSDNSTRVWTIIGLEDGFYIKAKCDLTGFTKSFDPRLSSIKLS